MSAQSDLLAEIKALRAEVADLKATKAAAPSREFPFAAVHPCTATEPCTRVLRTAKRAASHGKDGHFPQR